MNVRKKSFFFHYNKPLSKKQNRPVISIHYNGKCIFVNNLVVSVPTHGKIKKTQPMFIVCGKCSDVLIEDNNGFLVATIV